MATVLAGPHIGEHVACRRGQSKCVVKFAIAQLITNKPVTLTGYLRFPVATGLFRPRRCLKTAFDPERSLSSFAVDFLARPK
jgi:hypothetical protein